MDLNWSLDKIYTSFKSDEFLNDVKGLDKVIKDIDESSNNLEAKNSCKVIEEFIILYSKYYQLIEKLSIYANLKLSANTKDNEALKYTEIIEKKEVLVIKAVNKYQKYISEVKDIDSIIKSSKLLKEHEFFIREIVGKASHKLSDEEEKIIASMRATGSSAWMKLKDNVVSSLLVDIEINGESKQLPLTVILNMAYDKDKTVRKAAYNAEIKAYSRIDEVVAASLNGIKGEVITVSDLRHYKSPLHMTLEESRMDEETLDAMLSAMKDSMPMFRKYLRRKGELLGYKDGLPFYELYAPIVKDNKDYSYKDACDYVVNSFNEFSPKLGSYGKKAIDNKWIDVMPRENKVGGAFCENLHFIKESRFLLNFAGSFSDCITLGHELGHGFHGDCLNNEAVLNFDYPMPIAETASTFCETIIKQKALKNASKEEALSILETDICDNTQVIVDIYSRFLFEDNFFKKRVESTLSVEEIKELMLDSQRDAYGDGLDKNYLHPYMWLWKPHYYDADYNYYNFPYAFGLLFAKGLYAEYLKKGDSFVNDYIKLLSVTGKMSLYDIGKVMNFDIHEKSFWKESLKMIEKDIEMFLKLTEAAPGI